MLACLQSQKALDQLFQQRSLRFYSCFNELCDPHCDTHTKDIDNVLSVTINATTDTLEKALRVDMYAQHQEGRICPGEEAREEKRHEGEAPAQSCHSLRNVASSTECNTQDVSLQSCY